MKQGLVCLLFWGAAWSLAGCGQGRPEPIDKIEEPGPAAELPRALRDRNAALELGQDPTEATQGIRALMAQLAPEADDALLLALDDLDARLEASPDEPVSLVWANRVTARALLDARDKVYVFYGDLSDIEIADERVGFVRDLQRFLPWRGYAVEVDEDTSYEEWSSALLTRDAAGIVWRSHGNLGPSPYEPDRDHYMTRVLAHGGSRGKLWAGDWDALLGEGLALVVMSTCMSNGLYLPDDFALMDRPGRSNVERARFSTFETDIGDRALHFRGYRGPSFSPGLAADGWLALRYALVPRLDPARLAEDPDSFPGDFSAGVASGAVDLDWLPHLIAFAAAHPDDVQRVQPALTALADSLGQPLVSSDSAAWIGWWDSGDVQAAYAPHASLAQLRPAWDRVWAFLWATFETERRRRGGIPQPGPDCLLAWFHCVLDRPGLPERALLDDQQAVWEMSLSPDSGAPKPCPLEEELVVRHDAVTGELTSNLARLLAELDLSEVDCVSIY